MGRACPRGFYSAPRGFDGLRNRDSLGFPRFCMLLLKASCCISFCLSLPTCKMGLIPPTSLTYVSKFQCATGSGCDRQACCTTGVRGRNLDANLPFPVLLVTPSPPQRCAMGLSLNIPVSLVPGCTQRCPCGTVSSCEAGRPGGRQAGQRGELSLGVSPRGGPRSLGAGGVQRPIAGRSLCPRWLYGDRSLLSPGVWSLELGSREKRRSFRAGGASSARAGGRHPLLSGEGPQKAPR